MKKRLLLLIIPFCLFQYLCNAQKRIEGSVKGFVSDTTRHESMANATISVIRKIDSSLVAHTIAQKNGAFLLDHLDAGAYTLAISFQGYQTFQKKFSLSAKVPQVDFGKIIMSKISEMLSEVIIQRPPVTVKGDTVEFSAGAFKTIPNATTEDLLKKLPGVEVDKDGNVTAQGEAIQKIYVDGKEFFGTDPKMATKNIPADMVASVQVYDDMSDEAKFTKIDDGSRAKTINIKLKKNTRQGYFGKASVGHGNDDLYLGKIMMNRFYNDRRISFIGSSNNLNQQGFTSRDLVSGMGGFAGGNAGNGINTSSSAGINYTDIIGKIEIQGSYMYGVTNKRSIQTSTRKTLFPADSARHSRDSSTITDDDRISLNQNQNHNFNLRIEYKIDSMNSLLYTPTLSLQNSEDNLNDSNYTKISLANMEYPGLSSISKNVNQRRGVSLNNQLLYRRRFFTPGRTFTMGFRNSVNNSEGSGKTFSPLTFYNPGGGVDSVRQKDFLSSQTTRSSNYVISSSYTEPIGKNKIIELNYAYSNNFSTSNRDAFSYNAVTKLYDSINPQQTNYFKNKFIAHRVGLNFKYNKNQQLYFQAGGSMQASNVDNESIRGIYSVMGKDSVIHTKQSYINFFPTANFRYNFNQHNNIRLSYRGRTNQPNILQLQDVRDETNTLRTTVGNPSLKQEFNNMVNVSYKAYNPVTFRYINMNVNYDQTSNKIVNSIDFDTARGNGVQLIKPVNLNGTYNASYNLSVGIPLQKGQKGNSINMGNRMSFGQSVSQLYGRNNFTHNFSVSQSLGLNLDVKEKLNMYFSGRFSYNSVKYSVQQNKNNNLNSKYFSQDYSTDVNYYILKPLIVSTNFNYSINSGLADGYNVKIPLWNAALAWELFTKKNGELKFSVNDILNQNSNISRSIGENYISDSRTEILQRYFLLTFTFSFNRFGSRGSNYKSGNEMRKYGGGRMYNGG
ncbi:MAG: outer membrane beta-barrel protein [Ginsengibacter sp.]